MEPPTLLSSTMAPPDSALSADGGSNNERNLDPVFQAIRLSVVENSTSVDKMAAQDTDTQDSIVTFAIDGGVDSPPSLVLTAVGTWPSSVLQITNGPLIAIPTMNMNWTFCSLVARGTAAEMLFSPS